jgi:uncharacterized protein YbjT (DUF2867 family)
VRQEPSREAGLLCLIVELEAKGTNMKVVVVGGTGLIGSRLVTKLRSHGHDAVAAAPGTGVDALTREGLAEVLEGASVVVDVSNYPFFDDRVALDFFTRSTRNLLRYESGAGVKHHVVLSVVGTERLGDSGYFRAKMAQENLIRNSAIPYTIVHATQFYEFVKRIAEAATQSNVVRVAPVLTQPMAVDDVVKTIVDIVMGAPVNGVVEVAGPEEFRLDELIREGLSARKDPRLVISDPDARYFGATLDERTLVPADGARRGEIRFQEWLT